MQNKNGTGTLFLVALAIIGIILYVASRSYNLDYTDSLDFIFFGIGMAVTGKGGMLATARKLGYLSIDNPTPTMEYWNKLDGNPPNHRPPSWDNPATLVSSSTASDKQLAIMTHIGYTPVVFKGDARSDHFKGMMTLSPEWIAYFHMIEHGLLDTLSFIQAKTMLKMIANQVYQKQVWANKKKGRHHGLFGNVTKQCLARAFHCKHAVEYYHLTTSHDSVLFKALGQTGPKYYIVDTEGDISLYADRTR